MRRPSWKNGSGKFQISRSYYHAKLLHGSMKNKGKWLKIDTIFVPTMIIDKNWSMRDIDIRGMNCLRV